MTPSFVNVLKVSASRNIANASPLVSSATTAAFVTDVTTVPSFQMKFVMPGERFSPETLRHLRRSKTIK